MWLISYSVTVHNLFHFHRYAADVQAELDSVEAELELVELQIAELHEKKTELTSRKDVLLCKLEEACVAASASSSSSQPSRAGSEMSEDEMRHYDGTGTNKL